MRTYTKSFSLTQNKTAIVKSVGDTTCIVSIAGSASTVEIAYDKNMTLKVGDTVGLTSLSGRYVASTVISSEAEPDLPEVSDYTENTIPSPDPDAEGSAVIGSSPLGVQDIQDYYSNAEAINDVPVSKTTPTDGQVLQYNGTDEEWQPQTPSSGSAITGEIRMFAAKSVPSGWLKCDGTGVSRTTYGSLFSLLGLIHSQKLCSMSMDTAIADLAEMSIGTPISGGDNASYPKANAFDNSTSTVWRSSQLYTAISGNAYIGWNFGSAKKVRKITVKNDAVASYCPSSVLVQRSDDGTTWETVLTKTMTTTASSTTTIDIPEILVVSARYWRLLANANLASGYAWRVTEIEVYGFARTVHCVGHGLTSGTWITLDDIDAYGIEVYSNTGTALTFAETDEFRVSVIDQDNFFLDNGTNSVYYGFYIDASADIRAYDKDTFPVPDLRGEFVRGYDDSRGVDSARKFGVVQAGQIGYHRHTYTTKTSQTNTAANGSGAPEYVWGSVNSGYAGGTENNNENRPRNVVVNFIIKT